MGRVVGVVALKGGVGKTTSVVSLAYSLVNEFGKRVLVVDGDFNGANLGLHVGVANPEFTLHDVLDNKCLVSEAVYDHEYGFSVIAGALEGGKVDSKVFKNKLSGIKKYFDYVLVDTSPSLGRDLANVMAGCDDLYCVVTPDYATLAGSLRAVEMAKQKGWNFTGIVLNMVGKKGYELSLAEIEEACDVKVVGTIRENDKFGRSLSEVKPIGMFKPYSGSSLSFNQVAAVMSDSDYRKPNIFVRVWKNLL